MECNFFITSVFKSVDFIFFFYVQNIFVLCIINMTWRSCFLMSAQLEYLENEPGEEDRDGTAIYLLRVIEEQCSDSNSINNKTTKIFHRGGGIRRDYMFKLLL